MAEGGIIADLVLQGDVGSFSPEAKVEYYNRFCDSLGLNPLTRPFQYLKLNGKQVLYATKDATEQLRKINGVSVTDLKREMMGDVCIVTARGVDKSGRTDAATGAVSIKGLAGDALANALMKTETKAKRRLTLSICGLGILDETEIETIPDARPIKDILVDSVVVDMRKGRQKIDELIERYQTLLPPEGITAARLDMDAAKTVGDMRRIYSELKSAGDAMEGEETKERTRETFDTAAREKAERDAYENKEPSTEAAQLDIF